MKSELGSSLQQLHVTLTLALVLCADKINEGSEKIAYGGDGGRNSVIKWNSLVRIHATAK